MAKKPTPTKTTVNLDSTLPVCTIIMPISSNDECTKEHWQQVLELLEEVASNAGFDSRPAWIGSSTDIIHKKIVENIITADLAIVDVSTQNPNVMFELGLRLAMKKPTLIVSDDNTKPTFDAGLISHNFYPRSLNMIAMREFMEDLEKKLKSTHEQHEEGNYESFLQTLSPFEVVTPTTEPVTQIDHLTSLVEDLMTEVKNASRLNTKSRDINFSRGRRYICSKKYKKDEMRRIEEQLIERPAFRIERREFPDDHFHLYVHGSPVALSTLDEIIDECTQ